MRLLQRYILFELLKVFLFVLSGVTVMLLFVGVIREIAEHGLGPAQTLKILPFIVPSLLPFTIPATLLLTVSVVYGRLAGDQEITAAKAAGINVAILLWPSLFLGAVLSLGSLLLTDQAIPWAVGKIERVILQSMDELFFDKLRSQLQFVDRKRGVAITVMGVEDRTLVKPTFRYSVANGKAVTLQADSATLNFDLRSREIMLKLIGGKIDHPERFSGRIEEKTFILPLPYETPEKKERNMRIDQIAAEVDDIGRNRETRREQHIAETIFQLTLGEFQRTASSEPSKHLEINRTEKRLNRLKTEIHSRYAMACSCFFFVLVGGPFSVWQGKRQFLTSFIMCFIPIVLIYYPIVLLMMNQCKNGMMNPAWAMWVGNAVMSVVGLYFVRKVLIR